MIAATVSMTKIMDGMGLFCFLADDPADPQPRYSPCEVPVSVELGRTLHDFSQSV